MKRCIYEKKYKRGKILCEYTGVTRWRCPYYACKHFRPTLRYRLFGKWL